MEVQKTQINFFPMKRKYMTEQGDNNDEEGTVESANKNIPKHDLSNDIRQNIRETQNIQKSMVKKKRERKEEAQLMEEAHKRNEAREK